MGIDFGALISQNRPMAIAASKNENHKEKRQNARIEHFEIMKKEYF
jgi:hypothetical protein